MRTILIVGVVLGSIVLLFMLGYAVKTVAHDFGAVVAFATAATATFGLISLGFLVDDRRARTIRLLERIELVHGVDLSTEKAEVKGA